MNYITDKKMKATGYFKPYQPDGSYSLKTTGCGVYIIKHKEKVIYVGMSRKDLRNTMYRHFQTWNDRRSDYTKKMQPYERVTYSEKNRDEFTVKVIFCKGVIECEIMEQLLIRKLKPKDNSLKLYLYSLDQYRAMEKKIDNAEGWKSNSEEPPF